LTRALIFNESVEASANTSVVDLPSDAAYSAVALFREDRETSSEAFLAPVTYPKKLGIMMTARRDRIATARTISIRVNPFRMLFLKYERFVNFFILWSPAFVFDTDTHKYASDLNRLRYANNMTMCIYTHIIHTIIHN